MKLTQHVPFKISCAILSAILLSLGFPTLAFYYTAPFALIPLLLILLNERSAHPIRSSIFYIWIFGFIFQLLAFFWVSQPIVYFSALPDYIGYPLFVLISGLTSLYFVFLFTPIIFNNWLRSKNKEPIPLYLLALFITALEIVMPRFFDWTLGQIFNNLYFGQLASLFGFNTGTFFILFTNLTFAYAFLQFKNFTLLKKTLILNGAVWTSIFIFGFLRVSILEKEIAKSPKIRVAYIQPNFTFQELASKRIHATNAHEISLGTVLQMSSAVIAKSLQYDNKRPDLLVWPESTAPDMIFTNSYLQSVVTEYSKQWKTPILLQDTVRKYKKVGDTHLSIWSVSKIITPNGLGSAQYEKWVPIPFGEEFPLERLIPKLGDLYRSIIQNSSKVEVGTSYEALNVQNKFNVAPLICFDSIYQKLPYLQATYGNADLFVNQANFMWMVNSIAGLVFGYLDKARAVENARSMIMVSNTGPTIAFDPLGKVLYGPTPLMTSESGFVDVPLYRGKTLFRYVYYWPIFALTLIGIYRFILRLRSRSS